MNQFFVVLPSDSSMVYFPDNTVAHYKTKLVNTICNDGDYEVALVELMYPMNYNNFVVKEPLVAVRSHHGLENRWELVSGYFDHVDTLIDYMNKEYQKLYTAEQSKPLFTYDKATKQISLEYSGTTCDKLKKNVPFSSGLNDDFVERFGLLNCETQFELSGQRLMYVYSDIVDPYLVGDVKTPLLRVIAPKGDRDEIVTAAFSNPYYVPVARRGFDTIEVNINDELGDPMPFTGGKSVVILHFRWINSI